MRSPSPFWLCVLVAILCLHIPETATGATTVLFALDHGEWLPVLRVRGAIPLVEAGQGLRAVSSGQYSLRTLQRLPRGLPPPVVIDVEGLEVVFAEARFVDRVEAINHTIDAKAKIVAPVDLANVFVVFELHTEKMGTKLLIEEIGALRAGVAENFVYHGRIAADLGDARCTTHFYSDGMELLPSSLGDEALAAEIHTRIQAEIRGAVNQKARPYVVARAVLAGPTPGGRDARPVAVTATIRTDGSVSNALAEPGTPADFAEAAESAVRRSYFLPKIVDGGATECRITVAVVVHAADEK